MLEDALAFIRSLKILASDTFTVGVAGNASLKALTVLLKALALFTIATLGVALLSSIANFVRDRMTSQVSLDTVACLLHCRL